MPSAEARRPTSGLRSGTIALPRPHADPCRPMPPLDRRHWEAGRVIRAVPGADVRSGAVHGGRIGQDAYQTPSVCTRSAKKPPTPLPGPGYNIAPPCCIGWRAAAAEGFPAVVVRSGRPIRAARVRHAYREGRVLCQVLKSPLTPILASRGAHQRLGPEGVDAMRARDRVRTILRPRGGALRLNGWVGETHRTQRPQICSLVKLGSGFV